MCVPLLSSSQFEKADDEDGGLNLVESIERNAFHYIDIFSRAVDKVMPPSRKAPKSVCALLC
jgi:DNA replication licensing factor MCM7